MGTEGGVAAVTGGEEAHETCAFVGLPFLGDLSADALENGPEGEVAQRYNSIGQHDG